MAKGTLYFIPVTLGDNDTISQVLPQAVIDQIHQLDHFIVENAKTARQFLSACQHPTAIRELTFETLNNQTKPNELPKLLSPLNQGKDIGLMSEAGCPGVADPGAKLAEIAHQKDIRIAPLVGPSSILLSLMGSGMNGQRFTFLGYLPSAQIDRIKRLKSIERNSAKFNETQIFIETPYRNMHLLEDMVKHCHAQTKLCIARNITLPDEAIITKTIKEWQNTELPDCHKKPTVFLLQGQ